MTNFSDLAETRKAEPNISDYSQSGFIHRIKGKPVAATTLLNILIFIIIFSSTAVGEENVECKKFKVTFSSPMKMSFDGVFHGGNQIGTAMSSDNQHIESNMIDICVDKKHSSEIEINTVCYISENSIIIYNVWASGKDLPENSTVPGFSSKLSLFWYEIKLLFKSIIK